MLALLGLQSRKRFRNSEILNLEGVAQSAAFAVCGFFNWGTAVRKNRGPQTQRSSLLATILGNGRKRCLIRRAPW